MTLLADLTSAHLLMISSGLLGIGSTLLLAMPALLSIDSRATLVKLSHLKLVMTRPEVLDQQEMELLTRALRELAQERFYLRSGLLLLGLSFALSVVATVVGAAPPP